MNPNYYMQLLKKKVAARFVKKPEDGGPLTKKLSQM